MWIFIRVCMKYALNMGTDIIIQFLWLFLDNTGMKICVQFWKSSDDGEKFCSLYALMSHYAKWLWFEETTDKLEQTH